MRKEFDEELQSLNVEMIKMGMICEGAVKDASVCLLEDKKNQSSKDEEVDFSGLIDKIRTQSRKISDMCLRLILREQPVAKDLREISSALKMVTDLERIGVQAADIAEIASLRNISGKTSGLPLKEISEAARNMVSKSIDSYAKMDLNIALNVIKSDDVVDGYFDEIKRNLIKQVRSLSINEDSVPDLLMAAKYYERIADHAVNIAKWVVFCITGEQFAGGKKLK